MWLLESAMAYLGERQQQGLPELPASLHPRSRLAPRASPRDQQWERGVQALAACHGPALSLGHLPPLQSKKKKSKCMSPAHALGSSPCQNQVPLPSTSIPTDSDPLLQFRVDAAAPAGPFALLHYPGSGGMLCCRAPHPGFGALHQPTAVQVSPDGHVGSAVLPPAPAWPAPGAKRNLEK